MSHLIYSLSPILSSPLLLKFYVAHRSLHSFPTRRSSDLFPGELVTVPGSDEDVLTDELVDGRDGRRSVADRKSTRLNSSHLVISYAVFCLKKKKKKIYIEITQKLHACANNTM